MRERTEIISNVAALAAICALTGVYMLTPAPGLGPAGQGGSAPVEIALEALAEPPAPEPPAPAAPPPPQPEVVTPPPPPPPPQEEPPKPTEEPPKPVEMLQDEDGEQSKAQQLPVATPEVNSAFGKCLQKFAVYPSTKEARKLKPHGLVDIRVSVSEGAIVAVEITKSSGSPILDQAARSSVLKSNCGVQVGTGVVDGKFEY